MDSDKAPEINNIFGTNEKDEKGYFEHGTQVPGKVNYQDESRHSLSESTSGKADMKPIDESTEKHSSIASDAEKHLGEKSTPKNQLKLN